jgi:hypothetical protein
MQARMIVAAWDGPHASPGADRNMDLAQHLSDDQTALIGCALALLASGGLMWASYFVGQALRRERRDADAGPATIRVSAARPQTAEPRPARKAA